MTMLLLPGLGSDRLHVPYLGLPPCAAESPNVSQGGLLRHLGVFQDKGNPLSWVLALFGPFVILSKLGLLGVKRRS